MKLKVEKITAENSRIYGSLISMEKAEPAYKGSDFSFFKNLGQLRVDGDAGISIVESCMNKSAELQWLERHLASKEVIIPSDQSIVLVLGIGPDAHNPEKIQALELSPGTAFVVNEAVWHHAPVSSETKTKVMILLNFKTPDTDLEKVDIDPITFEL